MAASLTSAPYRAAALLLALASLITVVIGCTHARDNGRADHATSLVAVTGDFRADGSCTAVVAGAMLFAPGDAQRTSYDAGPVADLAPAGYTLRQLMCAPANADPALPPDHAGERNDNRMVLVTLYAREDAPIRAGRYTIRAGLATPDDTVDVATRAGVAVFGAIDAAPGASSGAGVRYLEGREGTLTITTVGPGADSGRVVASFSMRAGTAWSM